MALNLGDAGTPHPNLEAVQDPAVRAAFEEVLRAIGELKLELERQCVAMPTSLQGGYTVTNLSTDRSYDANSSSVAELADVLGTLLVDLGAS